MALPDEDVLLAFVKESNAIEEIFDSERELRFQYHLNAARSVAAGALSAMGPPSPLRIHEMVMWTEPRTFPGQLRQLRVAVGGRECPAPVRAQLLYGALMVRVDTLLFDSGRTATEDELWDLHHELEWIHPFIDGNGRTGRLWMNGLRLRHGYPWLTVYAKDREEYYARIRAWVERKG